MDIERIVHCAGGANIEYVAACETGVWLVDASGQVYVRMGSRPPTASQAQLEAAWIPIDCRPREGARFTHVFANASGSSVRICALLSSHLVHCTLDDRVCYSIIRVRYILRIDLGAGQQRRALCSKGRQ